MGPPHRAPLVLLGVIVCAVGVCAASTPEAGPRVCGDALECERLAQASHLDPEPGPATPIHLQGAASSIASGVHDSIPGAQAWSTCTECALEGGRVLLFTPSESHDTPSHTVPLSRDRWEGFFHTPGNASSVVSAVTVPGEGWDLASCAVVVHEPVYLITMIAWHPGHLLIDVLEQLHAMGAHLPGGRGRLFIQVASTTERPRLSSLILRDVYERDTPFRLLRLFSTPFAAIHSVDALRASPGRTCFRTLHVGLSSAETHHTAAAGRFPHVLPGASKRYTEFSALLREGAAAGPVQSRRRNVTATADSSGSSAAPGVRVVWEHPGPDMGDLAPVPPHPAASTPAGASVTVIPRRGTRRVINRRRFRRVLLEHGAPPPTRRSTTGGGSAAANALAETWVHHEGVPLQQQAAWAAPAGGSASKVTWLSMDRASLTDQSRVLGVTDILISQFGTALHNVPFLKPGSVVLLIMQPGWCAWHWMYSAQAVAAGMRVVVACHSRHGAPPATHESFRWHRRAWLQGPWDSKSEDFHVNEELLRQALTTAGNTWLEGPSEPRVVAVLRDMTPSRAQAAVGPINTPLWVAVVDSNESPQDDGSTVIKLVVEAFVPREWVEGHGLHRRGSNQLRGLHLCSAVTVDAQTEYEGSQCHHWSSFNEFSTLDLAVAAGTTASLLVRLWLRQGETDLQGSATVFPYPAGARAWLPWRTLPDGHATAGPIVHLDLHGRGERLEFDLSRKVDVQRVVATWCRAYGAGATPQCNMVAGRAHELAAQAVAKEVVALPPPLPVPTPQRPFVFLHVEKCGGSTVRAFIAAAAPQDPEESYIVCYSGRKYTNDCHHFGLSGVREAQRSRLAILAGHFNWGVWDELPSVSSSQVAALGTDGQAASGTSIEDETATEAAPPVSCLVLLRDPVARTISYFYERVYPHYPHRLSDIPPGDLRELLARFVAVDRGMYIDEGMSEATCKMLCGARIASENPSDRPVPQSAATQDCSVAKAVRRMQQCVVGILERWHDTVDVIESYFPWLRIDPNYQLHARPAPWKERPEDLPPETVRTILEANRCDSAVYQAGVKRFGLQLARLPVLRDDVSDQEEAKRKPPAPPSWIVDFGRDAPAPESDTAT